LRDGSLNLATCEYGSRYYKRTFPEAVGYSDYFGEEREFRSRVAVAMFGVMDRILCGFRTHLDVGCGAGYLVAATRNAGRVSHGFDSSAFAISTARALGYAGIRHSSIQRELKRAAEYDLVSLMDVIEHIPSPVEFLRDAFRLVGSGGALVVLTPRIDGRLRGEQGANYVHFHEDHCFYFSADTLSQALCAATGRAAEVLDVVDEIAKLDCVDDDVLRKYREDRDSIIGVVRKG
jgi:2-polyprenyl-3-methyl-5-hydroxy-6-metoxy-1,4-benzoquinol methylase